MLTKIKHQYQFVIVPFCLCKINLCFHLWKLTYFHYLKSYSILWEMALLQASHIHRTSLISLGLHLQT